MEFKVFENLISNNTLGALKPEYERVEAKSDEEIWAYLEAASKLQAVLLYSTPEFKNYLNSRKILFYNVSRYTELEIFRSLDEFKYGHYKVLIADDAQIALRGIDYRSYTVGIMFATMRSFTHEREFI